MTSSRARHLALLIVALAIPQADLSAQTDGTEDNAIPLFATQPGLGFGFSIGAAGFPGSTNSEIQTGFMFDGFARYGTSFGLFMLGGINLSTHQLGETGHGYGISSFYLEPRFVALSLSERIAPFVGARVGLTRESVDEPGVRLSASGTSLAGSIGAVLRLTDQMAIEGGFNLGYTRFGDYTFQGSLAWYDCLNALEPGTSLTESAIQCAAASDAPEQFNCYPPFYDRIAGDCVPPEIPYANTSRKVKRTALWIGIHVSLGVLR